MKQKLVFRLAPAAFIAMALLSQSQNAAKASTIFTDRTLFNAAIEGLQKTSNDFDSLVGTVFPNNYWRAGTGYQAERITVDNVTFFGNGGESEQTWILGDDIEGGLYDMNSISHEGNFVVAIGFDGTGEVFFEPNVHAFGFDYRLDKEAGSYPLAGTLNATIYHEGGSTTDYVMDTENGALFLGVYSADSIERILFNTTVRWPTNPSRFPYLLVDNMTLGSAAAVPEPTCSVASCCLAGFAFAIVGRRKRKHWPAVISGPVDVSLRYVTIS
jgi:hypothetical protein